MTPTAGAPGASRAQFAAEVVAELSRCWRSLEVRIRLCEEDLQRYRSRLERHDTEA